MCVIGSGWCSWPIVSWMDSVNFDVWCVMFLCLIYFVWCAWLANSHQAHIKSSPCINTHETPVHIKQTHTPKQYNTFASETSNFFENFIKLMKITCNLKISSILMLSRSSLDYFTVSMIPEKISCVFLSKASSYFGKILFKTNSRTVDYWFERCLLFIWLYHDDFTLSRSYIGVCNLYLLKMCELTVTTAGPATNLEKKSPKMPTVSKTSHEKTS